MLDNRLKFTHIILIQLPTSNLQPPMYGNLVSTEQANKFYYYATDGLGSTAGITDETGAVINEYQYDEFGNVIWEKANVSNPFKFTGAIHDKTANLYLMGSRFYNPKVGRFITQDSFGATFGADWTDHLYTYTSNNPVNMVDPTGHENLRDLVTYVGGSISYNAAAKAATVTIYKNGEYHNYTFSQQFFNTIDGRIQCSRSVFKNIISKPGTVYKHKETKKTTPLRPIVSVNASAARWQGGTQYVYFAESKEIYVYGSVGRTMSMANGSLMTGGVTGLKKPSDYESGYIGGSGNIGPVAGTPVIPA